MNCCYSQNYVPTESWHTLRKPGRPTTRSAWGSGTFHVPESQAPALAHRNLSSRGLGRPALIAQRQVLKCSPALSTSPAPTGWVRQSQFTGASLRSNMGCGTAPWIGWELQALCSKLIAYFTNITASRFSSARLSL